MNIHKHSKYKYTYYQNTHTIVRTSTHYKTHILQNNLKQPQHKIKGYTAEFNSVSLNFQYEHQ